MLVLMARAKPFVNAGKMTSFTDNKLTARMVSLLNAECSFDVPPCFLHTRVVAEFLLLI